MKQLSFKSHNFSIIKQSSLFIATLILIFFSSTISAQECGCTVQEVEDNTVQACDMIIGTVVEVASVNELRSAISQVNNEGGNMTILIADGTYPIASTASFPYITADDVVFRSLSGNRDAVIITGQGMVPTSSTEDGFLIAGNRVVIADLTIKDVGNHGIQVSGHDLIVHNVKIQDTYEQMIKGSTFDDRIDRGLVQCSLFEYTAGVGPNWYIGGLDIHKGHQWVVRDNVFKNIASPSGSIAEHAVHFWRTSADNLVERNVIYNCDRGIGFGLGNDNIENERGLIRNNIIYNDGTGLFNDVGIGLESSPGTLVCNNTIFVAYPNAIEYRFESTNNVEIINNLTNNAITSRNGGTADEQTNLTGASGGWFRDLENGNLRLVESHPSVVDQGTTINYVDNDIDQNPRPNDLPTDIGAHEWPLVSHTHTTSLTKIELSPNPATDFTTIKINKYMSQAQMFLYDSNGRLVKQTSQLDGSEFKINLDGLANGIYSIQIIENKSQIEWLKLIIQD